jgi:hypothetical protein
MSFVAKRRTNLRTRLNRWRASASRLLKNTSQRAAFPSAAEASIGITALTARLKAAPFQNDRHIVALDEPVKASWKCTQSAGAMARILSEGGWSRRLIGLSVVLASISIYVAAADTGAHRILLPIEVLGEDGTTVSNTITLQAKQAEAVHSLWLRTNNLRYPSQGTVRVNAGAWIPLQNESVTVEEPGKSYGGIGGGFATLGIRILLPPGTAVTGKNIIRFRFNQTDGISSGYRVLGWNFLTAHGVKIIPPEEFEEDNPDEWSPPLSDKGSIQTGRELWQAATLRLSSQPDAPTIRAHCADCHAQDGRDLKYFNFSNHSIVTRSRFHGLSTLQGEQIASYIRSLPFPNPGRPWNPPYQPGPGLDEQPVSNWAAGAGIEWALDDDVAALPHLLRQGSALHHSPAASAEQVVNVRQLVAEITPELFRPDGDLNPRHIPIALQLPDWNEWLPRVHPKDAWGPAFTRSEFGKLYGDALSPERKQDRGKATLRSMLASKRSGDSNLRSVVNGFDHWLRARRAFLKTVAKPGTAWSPTLTDKVYSTQLWQLVKTWELTQEFGLEGRGRDLNGASADSHTWFNTIPAETAPTSAHIPDGPAGVGGSALTNAYFNASWYELQILLNSGHHQHRDRDPVDWVYMVGWFQGLYAQTHQPEPVRLLVAAIKAQQSADPRLGPEDSHRGWQPDRNLDPRIMISPAWSPFFKPLPEEVHRTLTTSFLSAWIDKNLRYPISDYLPIGVRTEAYTYPTYGDITGGEVWRAARQFRDAGVPDDQIERLMRWGSAYTDRAARLQYEGRTRAKM